MILTGSVIPLYLSGMMLARSSPVKQTLNRKIRRNKMAYTKAQELELLTEMHRLTPHKERATSKEETKMIAEKLNEKGVKSATGVPWTLENVRAFLYARRRMIPSVNAKHPVVETLVAKSPDQKLGKWLRFITMIAEEKRLSDHAKFKLIREYFEGLE